MPLFAILYLGTEVCITGGLRGDISDIKLVSVQFHCLIYRNILLEDFPEDGLFMANRKELVGQFNGRNAVVNNYQIESGIEKAVYNGYMRAHAQDTREVSVLEEILTAVREGKTISIDGREIVRVYDSRKARNGYAFT